MKKDKTTGTLNAILKEAKPSDIQQYLQENEAYLSENDRPFAVFFRELLNRKKILRQDLFLRADISEGYGYKLLSEEKHTKQRDVILRLLLAAGCDLRDVDRALKLYHMEPLYSRVPRDAVLIIAINNGIFDIDRVNRMLVKAGMEELYSVREVEE